MNLIQTILHRAINEWLLAKSKLRLRVFSAFVPCGDQQQQSQHSGISALALGSQPQVRVWPFKINNRLRLTKCCCRANSGTFCLQLSPHLNFSNLRSIFSNSCSRHFIIKNFFSSALAAFVATKPRF